MTDWTNVAVEVAIAAVFSGFALKLYGSSQKTITRLLDHHEETMKEEREQRAEIMKEANATLRRLTNMIERVIQAYDRNASSALAQSKSPTRPIGRNPDIGGNLSKPTGPGVGID